MSPGWRLWSIITLAFGPLSAYGYALHHRTAEEVLWSIAAGCAFLLLILDEIGAALTRRSQRRSRDGVR